MLELRNITKEYVTGAEKVHALKGVDLAFRENEFVSILGASGCGKTTLLNIMGGLDQYTSGDLIINGVSTKQYKDADWDAYRNNSIGFVFQSYNLIPHQTVLANVELALTLSGVSPEERQKRAKAALEEVGLGDQLHKKPAQMSGGQMQRVAIARALINNPDILLADEPTGALDSETSVQIMNLIKKIAQDRLVVMVTHNPELAKEYSTRIVNLSDGRVTGDSDPYYPAAEQQAGSETSASVAAVAPIDGAGRIKNRSMSFKTAMQLSLNNLMTKKARTILTAFAGSIGIIGIALILSVSHGFQNYIDQMENDTLTSYPLTIQSETADMTSMVTAFASAAEDIKQQSGNKVKEQQLMSEMFASVGSNDLKTFNEYTIEKEKTELAGCFDAIQYSYGIQPQIYSTSFKYGVLQVCPNNFISQYMNSMQQTAMSFSNMDVFSELIDNEDINKDIYKVVAGKWPEKYNELVLILQDENTMTDYMSYSLGLRDPDEMNDMVNKLMKGEEVTFDESPMEWTYDDLLDIEFSLVPASSKYKYNSGYDVWEDMSDDENYMKSLVKDSEKLKITCIAIPNPDNTSGMSGYGIGYLPALTDHVIDIAEDAEIVKSQRAQKRKDIFSGKTFEALKNKENQALGFEDMISVDENKLKSAFGGKASQKEIESIIEKHSTEIATSVTEDSDNISKALTKALSDMCTSISDNIIEKYTNKDGALSVSKDDIMTEVAKYMSGKAYKSKLKSLHSCVPSLDEATASGIFSQILGGLLKGYGEGICAGLNTVAEQTEKTQGIKILVDGKYTDPTIPNPADPSSTMVLPLVTGVMQAAPGSYVDAKEVALGIQKAAENVSNAQAAAKSISSAVTMATDIITDMSNAFQVDPMVIASAFSMNMSEEELTRLITSYMSSGSDANCDSNLRQLGWADRSNPYSISYYLHDFNSKEKFMDFIDTYNDDMEKDGKEELVISYTDVTGVLLSSVKKITNAVSYVLIAFVAISLVVSSIMIGVITYISVLERTKEIGILRAIGASKKDISRIFNAETVIVGLCAGIIGIGISLLLLIPINAILLKLTGISALRAILPVAGAVILIIISVLLTLIAGLIPSGMASKKDPVEALRTE